MHIPQHSINEPMLVKLEMMSNQPVNLLKRIEMCESAKKDAQKDTETKKRYHNLSLTFIHLFKAFISIFIHIFLYLPN